MTEQELIEQLAAAEHASWARWMNYLFSQAEYIADNEGGHHAIIPAPLVERWKRQANTPYAQLTEGEKQSDRSEVKWILPIIEQFISPRPLVARQTLQDLRGLCDWLESH